MRNIHIFSIFVPACFGSPVLLSITTMSFSLPSRPSEGSARVVDLQLIVDYGQMLEVISRRWCLQFRQIPFSPFRGNRQHSRVSDRFGSRIWATAVQEHPAAAVGTIFCKASRCPSHWPRPIRDLSHSAPDHTVHTFPPVSTPFPK